MWMFQSLDYLYAEIQTVTGYIARIEKEYDDDVHFIAVMEERQSGRTQEEAAKWQKCIDARRKALVTTRHFSAVMQLQLERLVREFMIQAARQRPAAGGHRAGCAPRPMFAPRAERAVHPPEPEGASSCERPFLTFVLPMPGLHIAALAGAAAGPGRGEWLGLGARAQLSRALRAARWPAPWPCLPMQRDLGSA